MSQGTTWAEFVVRVGLGEKPVPEVVACVTRLREITSRARFGSGTSCTTETAIVDKPAEEEDHGHHHGHAH
jgi:hypothetical protein